MQHSLQHGTGKQSHLYATIDSTIPEIRVVKLLPSEDLAAPIQCQLSSRPLHSKEDSYEALSYVWGPQEFVADILIDSEPHLITRNLEMALRYLRLPTSPRALWVDAICINQNDPVERGQQVRLMKELYANCKSDLAWMLSFYYTLQPPKTEIGDGRSPHHPNEVEQLRMIHESMEKIGQGTASALSLFVCRGEGNEYADRFKVQLMKKIKSKDAAFLDEIQTSAEPSRPVYDESNADKRLVNPDGTRPEGKVDNFLLSLGQSSALSCTFHHADIWKRVWTMQELSHAPHVVLVAGHHQLDWEAVAGFLGDKPYADAFHCLYGHTRPSKALNNHFGGVQKVDHQRRIMRQPGFASRLLDVLARFQANRATDPRDHIYGLLGLATNAHDIVVDYSKFPAQVFKDATLCLIENAGNLDMLCQTTWTSCSALARSRLGEGVTGLPTWAADFSRRDPYEEHSRLLFAQRGIYGAGRPTLDLPCKIVHSDFLQLQAVILGRMKYDIDLKHSRRARGIFPYFAAPEWLKNSEIWMEIAGDVENTHKRYLRTGEPAIRAYWRTLLMDCAAYPITRLTSDEISAGDAAFKSILRFTGTEDELDDSLMIAGLVQLWDQLPESMRCMWTRNYYCWTFAVTENGLYTMVQNVMAGDFIASIEGAKVPLVLRPKDEFQGKKTYELVGTAYVHGCMDGEAFKAMAELGLVEDQILLQ